jgi:hypothetical protein
MECRAPVYIVCSPRVRVGKTLVARLLTEFISGNDRSVAAFDVNPDDCSLADCLPSQTTIANIDNTRAQIALFDNLIVDDGTAKIVDVGASSFKQFFALVHELGFVQEAHRRGLQPAVLFMADPDHRSIQAYANLRDRFPDIVLVPVYNGAVMRKQQARNHFPASQAGRVPVRISPIQPFLKSIIDRPGFSFQEFLSRRSDGETELHAWIRCCFLEFRHLEMRLLLEEMRPALQFAATTDDQLGSRRKGRIGVRIATVPMR